MLAKKNNDVIGKVVEEAKKKKNPYDRDKPS